MTAAEKGRAGLPILVLGALDGLYALIGPSCELLLGRDKETRVGRIVAFFGIGLADGHPSGDGSTCEAGEVGGVLQVVSASEGVEDDLDAFRFFRDGDASSGAWEAGTDGQRTWCRRGSDRG